MKTSRRSVSPSASSALLSLAFCLLSVPGSQAADSEQKPIETIYDDWYADAEFLMDAAEQEAWRHISSEDFVEREQFLQRFWASRRPGQRGRFESNRRVAREMRLRSPAQERAVVIAGPPRRVEDLESCDSVLRRIQLWHWGAEQLMVQTGSLRVPRELTVAFVQTASYDPRSFEVFSAEAAPELLSFLRRLDDPIEGILAAAVRKECIGQKRADDLAQMLRTAPTLSELGRTLGWRASGSDETSPPRPSPSRVSGAQSFGPGRLRFEALGAFFRTTILEGTLEVPVEELDSLDGRSLFDRVEIAGDIERQGKLVEAFRVVHHVAGSPPRSGMVSLPFYRKLLPGSYRLNVRATRGDGKVLLRSRDRVEVERFEEEAAAPAGRRGGFSHLTRDDLVQLTTLPDVRLQARYTDRVGDRVTLLAGISGGPIAAVEFRRDGTAIDRVQREPFVLEVALPGREHTFRAVALDDEGRVQASDELLLQRQDRPLRVRLAPLEQAAPPSEGSTDRRLPFALTVPNDAAEVRVRCFMNASLERELVLRGRDAAEELTAAASAQQWCPIWPPPFAGLVFARVVVETEGGTSEDLVVLSGRAPEDLDVLVEEVFVTLVDRTGTPVLGVEPGEFSVSVADQERAVLSVEPVQDLPLDVALLMDTSSSLGRRVRTIAEGAQEFFESTLRPGDRAALLSFSDDLMVRAPWTDDLGELRAGTLSVRGHGTTRLYDSIVYGIASFPHRTNRRALVVLTDGADTDSDYGLEQVLAAARRGGIAIYPVALGTFETIVTSDLRRLAEQTGGEFFETSGKQGLEAIYARIEKLLRTQYRVTFEADPLGPLVLPAVEVQVARPDLRVRTAQSPRDRS